MPIKWWNARFKICSICDKILNVGKTILKVIGFFRVNGISFVNLTTRNNVNWRISVVLIIKNHSEQRDVVRGLFRTPSNILKEDFCENRERLKRINYFRKKLHLKCSTGFWICIWMYSSNRNTLTEILTATYIPKISQSITSELPRWNVFLGKF